MDRSRRLVAVAPLAVAMAAALIVSACSSSKSTSTSSTTPPAATTTSATTSGSGPSTTTGSITISGFAYSGTLTVKAGQTITVTNKDSVAHTLTDRNGAFNTGAIQGGGSTTFVAPSMAGSYQLKCTFHPSMSGTLVVTP